MGSTLLLHKYPRLYLDIQGLSHAHHIWPLTQQMESLRMTTHSADGLTTHDLALTRCTHHSLPLIQQMYSPRMAIHSAVVLTTYDHLRWKAFSHIFHTICLGPCICLVSSCYINRDVSFILVLDYVPAFFCSHTGNLQWSVCTSSQPVHCFRQR